MSALRRYTREDTVGGIWREEGIGQGSEFRKKPGFRNPKSKEVKARVQGSEFRKTQRARSTMHLTESA